jgi:DnaJ-class molecular chaperone
MEVKIILCEHCKGTGKVENRELTNYHHREWDVWDDRCGVCDGAGRVKQTVTISKIAKFELELRKKPK